MLKARSHRPLVLLGHWIANRACWRAQDNVAHAAGLPRLPWRSRALMAGFLLCVTAANLWLLAQPMEMRTGM